MEDYIKDLDVAVVITLPDYAESRDDVAMIENFLLEETDGYLKRADKVAQAAITALQYRGGE
jgi:hypothetical protein